MKGRYRLPDSSYDPWRESGGWESGAKLYLSFFIFKEADANMVKY